MATVIEPLDPRTQPARLIAGYPQTAVRNPAQPTEVAYFNPGDVDPTAKVKLDQAWGHIRYVPETGEIWFATATGGFWVVQLEQGVQAVEGGQHVQLRQR